jgi:hypothetical protein
VLEKNFAGFLAIFKALKVNFIQSEKEQKAHIFCYRNSWFYRRKLPRPVQPASEALPPCAKPPNGPGGVSGVKLGSQLAL